MRKDDAVKAELQARRIWAGLSQLRRAIEEGDPMGEIRTRVNDLVADAGALTDLLTTNL